MEQLNDGAVAVPPVQEETDSGEVGQTTGQPQADSDAPGEPASVGSDDAGNRATEPIPAPVKPRRSHAKKRRPARKSRRYPSGITRTRTVWGRRKVELDGRRYVIEMGADGVRVTEKGKRQHAVLQWHTLIKLSRRQQELFDSVIPSFTEVLRRAELVRPAETATQPVAAGSILGDGVQGGSGQPAANS